MPGRCFFAENAKNSGPVFLRPRRRLIAYIGERFGFHALGRTIMTRVIVTVIVVTVVCAVGYYVFTHPNLSHVERLSEELEGLKSQNRALAAQNDALEKKIVALRDDPRLAERRARETVGLARPGEIIFQFEEPSEVVHVQVRLLVQAEKLELAGKKIAPAELETALIRLRNEISSARLAVVFSKDADAILRQRVTDIVDASPMAPAEYNEM